MNMCTLCTFPAVLWNCNHPDGKELVLLSNKWKNTLNGKRTELIQVLQRSNMLEHLQQLGVVDLAKKNELKVRDQRVF